MKVPISVAALAAASVLALTACGGAGADPGVDPTTDDAPTAADFDGRWVAEDPEDAFLEFKEVDENGGTVSGTDGCNGVQGEFHVDGDTASIDRGPGTLKGCPDIDTWLKGVTVVVLDGDTLSIQNDDGEELGTLTREDADDATPMPSGSASASLDEAEGSEDGNAEDSDEASSGDDS